MQFSISHNSAILSAFPVTLTSARLFEKPNNLTKLGNPEILHFCKTLVRKNRQQTFKRANKLQQQTFYNAAGLAIREIDANGNTRVHQYNAQYYRTQTNLPESQVIKYTPNAFGDITDQNNPGPNDITRVFDKRRRLTSETNGANEQTKYEYDLNNNRTAVIKPDNTR